MKLHAIEDRSDTAGQHKRAGDAWDIYRILVDLDADGSVREGFVLASATLCITTLCAREKLPIKLPVSTTKSAAQDATRCVSRCA
jgi:hypothetical protein